MSPLLKTVLVIIASVGIASGCVDQESTVESALLPEGESPPPCPGHLQCCEDNYFECAFECSRCYGTGPNHNEWTPEREFCEGNCQIGYTACKPNTCRPKAYVFCAPNLS
jgi:hypothetical protein